jgi:hypothetical protein
MALTDFSGLTINSAQTGIQFTKVTDTSTDWSSVSNSTYFYDKAAKLVYYKDANGVVQNVYRTLPSVQSIVSAATVTPTANDDLVVITAQAVALTLAAPTEYAYLLDIPLSEYVAPITPTPPPFEN